MLLYCIGSHCSIVLRFFITRFSSTLIYIYFDRSGKACPFVLRKEELAMLARRAGRLEVSGFNYAAKNAPGFWPYPCPRPRFKVGWEYRLNNTAT